VPAAAVPAAARALGWRESTPSHATDTPDACWRNGPESCNWFRTRPHACLGLPPTAATPCPCLTPPPFQPPQPGSFPDLPYDEERDIEDYKAYAEKLLPFVTDTIE
jgi:hypothetical protein